MVTSVIVCLAKRSSVAETRAPKQRRRGLRSLAHRLQEVAISLGSLEFVVEEFHRLDRVELGEDLAENPDPVQHALAQKELLLARSRARDVDRREDALVHQ